MYTQERFVLVPIYKKHTYMVKLGPLKTYIMLIKSSPYLQIKMKALFLEPHPVLFD